MLGTSAPQQPAAAAIQGAPHMLLIQLRRQRADVAMVTSILFSKKKF